MKIRIPNGILIIDILSLLLVLVIAVLPDNPIRIVLALPFILFFPGYTLISALVARKDEMSGIEKTALGFGLSIASVVLIGLGLNYTPWGIRLESELYSLIIFILVMSGIALLRRRQLNKEARLTSEFTLKVPGWEGGRLDKVLVIVLAIAVLGALSAAGYAIAKPKAGEKFTEFYLLGLNGKAENYPSQFTLTDGKVVGVMYGATSGDASAGVGKVLVGIINNEQEKTSYDLELKIDGAAADINYSGGNTTKLSLELVPDQKWEGEIGFAPQHVGDSQKVEFFLSKNGSAYQDLHLWINVN